MKRLIAIAIFLHPVVFIVLSLLFNVEVQYDWHHYLLFGFGLFVAGLNVYTSWVRAFLHKILNGDLEDYKFVSGIPILGNVAALVALWHCGNSWVTIAIVITILVLDTGGMPWFVIATWRDDSLWGKSSDA
jgi:hypothetical protein